MPLVRFKIRNELSLGGPTLNRSAAVEYEEPKAILGAVEVAGLVGILRQLGDLAEFSAEVFNGIQEEVTVTASRCQKLTSRVKRIESALSPLEKAVLSQTSHIHFAYTAGCEWHPRIRSRQRHFVQSDLPLCIMETYEQCRDPPPLHLLDRFDFSGPGSCLRKYSDPTFFRKELSNPSKADNVKPQKDLAHCKRKKKRLPQRNICRSHAVSTSDETNGAHVSSLTGDRHSTSQSTSTVDMPLSSNMQDLSDAVDQSLLQGQSDSLSLEQSEAQVQLDFQESSKARESLTGSGYIEYVINQSPVDKPDAKLLEGFLSSSSQPADRIGSAVPKGCTEVVDDNILYSPSTDVFVPCASIVCDENKETTELIMVKSSKDEEGSEIHESKFGPGTPDRGRQHQRDLDSTYIFFDEADIVGDKESDSQVNSIDKRPKIESEGENKSEQGSEADEFVDARNTIESDTESEVDGVLKPKLEHYFGDISTYCSDDANSDNNDGSEDIPYAKMSEDPRHDNCLDESYSGSYHLDDTNVFCFLSDSMCLKTVSHDETFQKPREVLAMCPSLLAEEAFPDETILREQPVAAHPLLAGDCADEKIAFEELSRKDAIPAEKILPEEHLANYSSLAEAVPHENIFPGDSAAKYPSFAEIALPKIPSLAEAVPDNMTPAEEADGAAHPSPEVLDSNNLSVPDADSLEEIFGTYPCLAEAVLYKKFLTEEPATVCMSLSKVMPIEKLLPEKALEMHPCLAESPQEMILLEKSVDSPHPSCVISAPPEDILSPEILDSTNLPVAETISQEQIELKEIVGRDPCLAKAVSDERVLREEPVTTCLSLTRAVAIEKALPEELLVTYPSLAELPEETSNATHPSKAVRDENISQEVSGYTNLSVEESLSPEQISELVAIDPCLVIAVPDESFLPEEHVSTCLSLKKAVTVEGVLPEKTLEIHPSFAELPEEKILHEEADDATHPSDSETISDEQNTPEVLDSTDYPVAAVLPQEQILLAEFVSIAPCLIEVIPDRSILLEEPVTTCMSLTKPVHMEELLPEEPYDSFEKLPKDRILQVKSDDGTHQSCAKADCNERISPEVLDSESSSVAVSIPQEKIALEEFVDINPCLSEAVPDERVLPEESVTTCPNGRILPEEPLEVYPSLEELPEEQISQEEEPDDATHPSFSEAVPDEKVLAEEPVTTYISSTKDSPFGEILPAEPLEVYPSMEELLEEKILQEEPVDATFSEAVGDKKISPLERLGSTYPSLEESVLHEETLHEELAGTNPFLELAVPTISSSPEEPGVTYQSSAEAVSKEKNLLEEPLPTYPSFTEAVPDKNISLEESDVFDENTSCSEDASYTREAGLYNPEEPVARDLSLAEAGFDEKIISPEAPGSTIDTGPHIKTFPEEPVATYLSLAEPLPDDNVLPKEPPAAYLDLAEGIPDQKVFLDDAAFLSFAEAIFDQKFSPEVPDSSYPSLREEMIVAPPSLVTKGEVYDEPYTVSDVSMKQKSGSLEPESADITIPSSGGTVMIFPDTQGSMSNGTVVESVSIWSNGGLLGLAPSKPPVLAEPNSVSEHIQNEINEPSVLTTRKQESSSRSVKDIEKSSSSLVVSNPTFLQQSSMLRHSNGSHSHQQNTATSFKVFGLSHKLLMAGFRGNSSSTCKFESIPTTIIHDTEVAAIKGKTQQTPSGSSFEEQLDNESSFFDSPTSSPPVEHMRISFNTKDASSASKLKLRIPCQPQANSENADMFPSFQLVQEGSNSDNDDDNSDIFCQSSPENCLSDSELWESDESPEKSVSSLKQVGEKIRHWEMGSFSGSYLDLPCFDSIEHQSTSSRLEQEQEEAVLEYKPSVSEIIRDWPPNQPKSSPSPSNDSNADALLNETQNQPVGYL